MASLVTKQWEELCCTVRMVSITDLAIGKMLLIHIQFLAIRKDHCWQLMRNSFADKDDKMGICCVEGGC